MKRIIVFTAILCLGFTLFAQGIHTEWVSTGFGGGSGSHWPRIFQHGSGRTIVVSSDMGQVFVSRENGDSWEILPTESINSNTYTRINFTRHPDTLYAIHNEFRESTSVPAISTDGGNIWKSLPIGSSQGSMLYCFADPNHTQRLIIAKRNRIYFSHDAGENFHRVVYISSADLYIADVFWHNQDIFIATNKGIYYSKDGGSTFQKVFVKEFPSNYGMLSMSGVLVNGTLTLYVIARRDDFDHKQLPWSYEKGNPKFFKISKVNGQLQVIQERVFEAYPYFVASSQMRPNTLYIAGADKNYTPMVLKSTDGGKNWSSVFNHDPDNNNIATGFAGVGGPFNFKAAETAMGFTIDPLNPDVAIIGDFSFLHMTEDGGHSWKALYVKPEERNPASHVIRRYKAYSSNGYENTSIWDIVFTEQSEMLMGMSDFTAAYSNDQGASWVPKPAGLNFTNTIYQFVKDTQNHVYYGAGSGLHDFGQTTYISPNRIERNSIPLKGQIFKSTVGVSTWEIIKKFDLPVVSLALDPNNPNIMYAALVSYAHGGGIYKTSNLDQGANAQWEKLPDPPRTLGHPYRLKVLHDGSVVCSFTATRTNEFQRSSGIFYSEDGGRSWHDRSALEMEYYTKDVIIDPHDSLENTWYACVWNGWGNINANSHNFGGLYKSTDRGQNWERIWSNYRVESATVHPLDPNLLYVSTEDDGLWLTENLNDPAPFFFKDEQFLFFHPTRIFFHPEDPDEVWVSNFGNGPYKAKRHNSTTHLEKEFEQFFSLYPNPMNTHFSIKLKNYTSELLPQNLSIHLYDLKGRKIWEKAWPRKPISLDRSQISTGIFVLQIHKKGKLLTAKKLVIK